MKIINKVTLLENTFGGIKVGETFARKDNLRIIYMRTLTVGTMYNAIDLITGHLVWICSDTPIIRVKATLIVSNEEEPEPEPP